MPLEQPEPVQLLVNIGREEPKGVVGAEEGTEGEHGVAVGDDVVLDLHRIRVTPLVEGVLVEETEEQFTSLRLALRSVRHLNLKSTAT